MRGIIGHNHGHDLNDLLYNIRKDCLLIGIEQEDELKSLEAKIQFISTDSYEFDVKKDTLMKYNEILFPYIKKESKPTESKMSDFVKKYKEMVEAGVVDK